MTKILRILLIGFLIVSVNSQLLSVASFKKLKSRIDIANFDFIDLLKKIYQPFYLRLNAISKETNFLCRVNCETRMGRFKTWHLQKTYIRNRF